MDLGLRDKVAVITGGSIGIGLAVAKGFAAEGAHVLIAARNPERLAAAAPRSPERRGSRRHRGVRRRHRRAGRGRRRRQRSSGEPTS